MKDGATNLLGLLAIASAIGAPSSAWACRTLVPNDVEIARHDGVVVVAVLTGTRLKNPDWNVWRLTTRTVKTIAGSVKLPKYTFTTTQSSGGCGMTPLPPAGEKWVVYSDHSAPGRVAEAFPLPLARQHDPRLANVR
jgi:hypothetical protein